MPSTCDGWFNSKHLVGTASKHGMHYRFSPRHTRQALHEKRASRVHSGMFDISQLEIYCKKGEHKTIPLYRNPSTLCVQLVLALSRHTQTPANIATNMSNLLRNAPRAAKHFKTSFPDPNILLVTINRPEVLNSLTVEASYELDRVFKWFDNETSLRVAIITGAGKAFCVGADLKGEADRHATFILDEHRFAE